jgi:predicted flavoprotein YhiN
MTNTKGEPQQTAQLRKLLHEFKNSSVGTLTTQLRRLVMTKELGMHCVAAKFVPRILTADQKQQHVNVCTKHKISVPHQPYSPDLAPSDFFLFPNMKLKLKPV